MLRVGLIVNGPDNFFLPVERTLRERYNVERFEPHFVRLPFIGTRINDQLLRWQLAKFIERSDVTFIEWVGNLAVLASHLPKRGCIVARMHSIELATSVEQVNWHHVDHLIVLNQALRHRLSELVRGPLPPTTIVANGVDLSTYHPTDRIFDYQLGMVCALHPIKRIYEVILAVYQLRQEGYPYKLRIAGGIIEGEARRYAWALESLVAKLDLSNVVTFSGHVANVSDWLRDIDVFISSSYWEGQQVALIEAMASGSYCLGHCWDGVEEVLPTENVFTTNSDLCAKLVDYASLSKSARQQAQAQMRAIAEEKFGEQRMIDTIIEVVQSAVQDPDHRRAPCVRC